MTIDAPQPKRGEIWYVNLDPTVGAEIRKRRPVVVVNLSSQMEEITAAIAAVIEYQ